MTYWPRNIRDVFLVTFTVAGIAALLFVSGIIAGKLPLWSPYIAPALALLLGLAIGVSVLAQMEARIDPWDAQRDIMRMSSQPTPERMMLTKHSFMYLGLTIEEVQETMMPMMEAALAHHWQYAHHAVDGRHSEALYLTLKAVIPELIKIDAQIKRTLARVPEDFVIEVTAEEAIEIADGATDMMVVGAGFAIASGVPGAPCFADVDDSNHSKANPLTGNIDLDATGKWIKGPNYRKPNLRQVLERYGAIGEEWPRA